MSLISFYSQEINLPAQLSGWVDSKPAPDLIDSVTYDLYESSNPLRKTFGKDEISNNGVRKAVNTTTRVGAEAFSAFANPYYLSHKITHIPIYYQTVVNKYKQN
jgi:putative IMPACT (imprinted ancient) family translation regulator